MILERLSRLNAIPAREAGSIIRQLDSNSSFTQRDIYNARAAIRAESLEGRTPTQALLVRIQKVGLPYQTLEKRERIYGLV